MSSREVRPEAPKAAHPPGTRWVREYRGKTYEVAFVSEGEYHLREYGRDEFTVHESLTGCSMAIAKRHRRKGRLPGPAFFGAPEGASPEPAKGAPAKGRKKHAPEKRAAKDGRAPRTGAEDGPKLTPEKFREALELRDAALTEEVVRQLHERATEDATQYLGLSREGPTEALREAAEAYAKERARVAAAARALLEAMGGGS